MKMIEENIKTIDLSLEDVKEKDGKIVITVKSLTKDFEEDYVLEMIAEDAIGKHYIWRHRHPIDPKHKENHVYGKVLDSKFEEYLVSEIELYNHTKDHLAYIELLKERQKTNDPLGLSMRYRKYYDKNNKVVHVDVFEESGTPIPQCNDCKTLKMGVIEMKNEKKEDEKSEEDILEESKVKIEELEKILNSKTKCLEDYKTKIESLEKELKKKDETLESTDSQLEKLQDTVVEMGLQIEYLSTKKPIMDKILEVKKLDEAEVEFYKGQKIEYLEEKYEEWSKEAEKPHVQSMQDSANEAIKLDEEKEKKKYIIDGKEYTREEAFKRATSDFRSGGLKFKK